jgi:hypothetical protein
MFLTTIASLQRYHAHLSLISSSLSLCFCPVCFFSSSILDSCFPNQFVSCCLYIWLASGISARSYLPSSHPSICFSTFPLIRLFGCCFYIIFFLLVFFFFFFWNTNTNTHTHSQFYSIHTNRQIYLLLVTRKGEGRNKYIQISKLLTQVFIARRKGKGSGISSWEFVFM